MNVSRCVLLALGALAGALTALRWKRRVSPGGFNAGSRSNAQRDSRCELRLSSALRNVREDVRNSYRFGKCQERQIHADAGPRRFRASDVFVGILAAADDTAASADLRLSRNVQGHAQRGG